MRQRVQKPFGFSGDVGLPAVSQKGVGGQPEASRAWRTSAGRDQTKPPLPRIGQILLAVLIVTAMALVLHLFFY